MRVPNPRDSYIGPEMLGGTPWSKIRRLERAVSVADYRARQISAAAAAGMRQAAAAGAAAATRRR